MALVANQRQLDLVRLVRAEGPITRGDIGRRTGLSAGQVSRLVADLLHAGLIEADARQQPRTGRPSDLLRLAANGPWVVGMEVGAGNLDGIIANLRGEVRVRLRDRLPAVDDHQGAVDLFAGFAERLAAEAGIPGSRVLGFGIGLQAVVDPEQGAVVDWSEHPGWGGWWRGFGLRDALRDRLGSPTVIIDDAVRMRAVAEARRGPTSDDFIFVLADSGIGASLVIDGRPYLGPNRLAGEIGHVSPEPSTQPCPCGRVGCLEAVASSVALEREAGARWPREQPDIGTLLVLADLGDPVAVEIVERAGSRLAAVLAAAVGLICPGRVVVGGVLGRSPRYLDATARELTRRTHPRTAETLRVQRSALGPDAGVVGAAMAAIDRLFSLTPLVAAPGGSTRWGTDGDDRQPQRFGRKEDSDDRSGRKTERAGVRGAPG